VQITLNPVSSAIRFRSSGLREQSFGVASNTVEKPWAWIDRTAAEPVATMASSS